MGAGAKERAVEFGGHRRGLPLTALFDELAMPNGNLSLFQKEINYMNVVFILL